MNTPEEAGLAPLTSDEAIVLRVSELVGAALRRQVWMMFLDEEDVQMPVVMPMEDYPLVPERDSGEALALSLGRIMEFSGATQAIVVWERHLGPGITPPDRAWARALAEGCRAHGVRLRAQLVSHVEGVRWLAPDDYLEAAA